jgi:hypothetical protein
MIRDIIDLFTALGLLFLAYKIGIKRMKLKQEIMESSEQEQEFTENGK